jgi:hypothetical protein
MTSLADRGDYYQQATKHAAAGYIFWQGEKDAGNTASRRAALKTGVWMDAGEAMGKGPVDLLAGGK